VVVDPKSLLGGGGIKIPITFQIMSCFGGFDSIEIPRGWGVSFALAMLEVDHGYQSRPGLLAGPTNGGCPG